MPLRSLLQSLCSLRDLRELRECLLLRFGDLEDLRLDECPCLLLRGNAGDMLFIERSWDTPLIDTSSRSFRSIIKSLFGSTISPLFSFFGFSFIMSLLFSLLSIALFEFFLILSKLCESTLFLLLVLLFSSSAILPTSVLLSVFTTLSTSLFSASSNDFLFFPFCSLSAPSVPYEKTYHFHQSLWWKMKIGQSCRGCEVGKNLFFDSHRLGELMTW